MISLYLPQFRRFIFICLIASLPLSNFFAAVRIARLKYSGGGDWYANPSSIQNWKHAIKKHLGTKTEILPPIDLKGSNAWEADLLYATGHGNINFSKSEAENLRNYLLSGGFLWVDDNYGMDQFFRRNLTKVFPDKKLVTIGSNHPIYTCFFKLKGLPKVHEHDGKPSQGYALFHEGRMILYYSFSSDIGDGLEDADVHNVPTELRTLASEMAVNLVYYILNH